MIEIFGFQFQIFDQEILSQALRDTQMWEQHLLFFVCTILATIVGSLAGATASTRVRMDMFGVICCGTIAALGGGTLRDIMLSGHINMEGDLIRVYWTTPSGAIYLYFAVLTSFAVFVLSRFYHFPVGTIRVADALALAFFTIIGVSKAQLAGADALVCMFMGTCTGVAGGALRDVLTGNVPYVFRPGELYATPAVCGCIAYMGMQLMEFPHWICYFGSIFLIFAFRMFAVYWNWQLPTYRPLFERAPVEEAERARSVGKEAEP